MNKQRWCLLALALLMGLLLGVVYAQTGGEYNLTWWTFDGGGTTVTGDSLTLMGTAGQPEAGPVLSGGDFSLTSGFWPSGGSSPPPCPIPITGVSLSGPDAGETYQALAFSATPQPVSATTPINYTWSSDGLVSGQGTSQATYLWHSAGTKNVQVAAQNCGGSGSDSKTVVISDAIHVQLVYLPVVFKAP